MDDVHLPPGDVSEVDANLSASEFEEIRRRGRRDELAPENAETFSRYLVYLGMGYVEAERAIDEAGDASRAFDELHRLFGAVGGRAAVLNFHYGERARGFAEERRAHAALERMAGAYERLVDKMQAEIVVREERVRNLETALDR